MGYIDFELKEDNFGSIVEHKDGYAILSALKNIILSKPGNYPFTPNLGVNIEKYVHEIADEMTLDVVSEDIRDQIKTYIPNTGVVDVDVMYINNDTGVSKNLGIKISLVYDGEMLETGIVIAQTEQDRIQYLVDSALENS